jgi:enoyl-CoA hydratase/carnithine racemase
MEGFLRAERVAIEFGQQLDQIEHIYFEQLMRTDDAHEGIRAFMEKRAPVWQAR